MSRPQIFRLRRLLVIGIVCGATNAAFATDAPIECVPSGLSAPDAATLVAAAVQVLERSGFDPAAYTVSLRQEVPHSPEFREIGARLEPSVIFSPAVPGALYPVRVHALQPCAVAWVWRPERFTARQREVLDRAESLLLLDGLGRGELEIGVYESLEWIRVQLWPAGSPPGDSAVAVTLRKSDLEPLEPGTP